MAVRIESLGTDRYGLPRGRNRPSFGQRNQGNHRPELESGNVKLLIMDFHDVTFMDSSGIGLVMGRYRQIKFYDGELQAVGTSSQIYKVMRVAGLDRLCLIERSSVKK